MSREDRHCRAAKRLREVATLIDELQNNEVELADSETVSPDLEGTEPAALIERADRLENGGLRLAIVGSSRRGKSTLINALLGEKLLPMGRMPTTAVITQIIYGESKEVKLIEKHSSEKTILRQEFVDECVLEPGREIPQAFANIAYAVLESNCFLCEKGLQIVDTPGLNARSGAERATLQYLDQADAMLIVIDCLVPFDDTDLALLNSLKRIKGSKLDHVFFIINARNLDAEGEKEALALARRDLKNSFDAASFKRPVFVVDAEKALKIRCGENTTEDLKATGLPAFEHQLIQFLESDERVDVILDAAVCNVLIPNLSKISSYMAERTVLETNQHTVEDKVALLEQKADSIQNIVDNFTKEVADAIANDLFSQLGQLINESNPEWNAFDIEPGILKLSTSNFASKKRNELLFGIDRALEAYRREHIHDRQSRFFKEREENIKVISEKFEKKIAAFVKDIDITDTSLLDGSEPEGINQISKDGFELNLPSIGKSVKRETGLTTKVLTSIVVASSAALMPFINLTIRLLLVSFSISGIVWFCIHRNKKPVKIRIREQLKRKLEEKEESIKAEIRRLIVNNSKAYSEKFQAVLQTEIEHIRAQSSTVPLGESRLETINTLFTEEFEKICQSVYQRVPTHQEQQRFLKNGDYDEDRQKVSS